MYTDEKYVLKRDKEGNFDYLVYIGEEKTVYVPAELEDDKGCFSGHDEIEELIYTNGNKIIRDLCCCAHLKKIHLSESIEEFVLSMFGACPELTELEVDGANPYFTAKSGMLLSKNEETLIRCAPGIKGTVNVPETVKEIDSYAFYQCDKIESIILPADLEIIGEEAFCGCKKMKSINLPEKIDRLPFACFFGCKSLERVNLRYIKYIKECVFKKCANLHLVVPANVCSIAYAAFDECRTDQIEFEECKDGLLASSPFGATIEIENELKTFPNLPLALFDKPDLKLWLVMGFCSNPDLYSGYIRKQYEKYAKSQKKRILKKAKDLGYDKVFAYYGEEIPKKANEAIQTEGERLSFSMTLEEAKRLFKFTKRKTGISINGFKQVDFAWNPQGVYESYYSDEGSNRLVLPDFIDGEEVGHIAVKALPNNVVVICNNLVFNRLSRVIRAVTSCAYLDSPDIFPDIQVVEIKNFIAKYPSDVAGQLITEGNAPGLTKFMDMVKISSKLQEEMLEMAAGKAEMTAIILNKKQKTQKGRISQKEKIWNL